MSKFNKNSQAETECDTTLSGDVDTVDGGAVNLTNPYGGWSMQDESPDESGVDVNEGETSSISSSNGTFRKITHCTLDYYSLEHLHPFIFLLTRAVKRSTGVSFILVPLAQI